jgi:hypothetical protein
MTMRLLRLAGLLLSLWIGAAAGAPEINAWLERSRIAEGESVQLTLEAPGRVSGRPDTAPLEDDFEVLGLSTGNRVSIVNGRTDARTTWTLTLSPKHSGRLTVPSLRVGDGRSRALQLEVSAVSPAVAGSDADILLETELAPRRPYVQGQVRYTLRLLHAIPISGGELSEPTPANTLVQKLGEDRDYVTTRNGRRYQVIERRYALFPQASGTLELPAPVFDGEVPDASRRRASPFKQFFGNDPFFGEDPFGDLLTPTRRVRVRGEPAVLEVQARPAAAHGAHWLPAEQLRLHGEWQPADGDIRVGEPVTLALQIEAQGLTGGQLPSPAPEGVDGFSVYPDQAQRETSGTGKGVTGRLQQKIAFIPRRAGQLVLPDIEVYWWDTQAERERQARLPGRVLRVLPAAGRSTPASAPAGEAVPEPAGATPPASGDNGVSVQPMPVPAAGRWPWISAALAAGWLLTLMLWWWQARRVRAAGRGNQPATSPPDSARTARRRFLAACEAHDAPAARRTLLEWAALHWPANPPRGLEALAQRLDDPQAREALAELDRALYRKAEGWDGRRLRRRLQRLPEPEAVSGRGTTVLAPLYPDAQRHSRA